MTTSRLWGLAPITWLAAGAWIGALVQVPVPLAIGPVVAALGWRRDRLALMVVGLGLLASSLGARSIAAVEPVDAHRIGGEVTLLGDPSRFGPSLRVDVGIGGQRFEAWARGQEAARLAPRLMGERVVLSGRVSPRPDDTPWLVRRRVVGRLTVDDVGPWRPGNPASRAANGLRRTLAEGAEVMDGDTRSLYAGLLLGDQRNQGPVVTDDFRGSGLSHLLAVSGQNVAFVLVLVGPLLRRMRLTPRLLSTIAVLAFFALVTRFEPSVMRATTMAGCAAVAVTLGREAASRRMLATAVLVLVLYDPLIARQLAFQLSVAATLGILLLSEPIAAAIPGPKPLAQAVAVTVAAQVAVAPLLIPTFGGMPMAALIANVLAAPATGPVVVWGIPAGLIAGIVGGRTAELVHVPTSLMVNWIARVAAWGASLPLGEVRTGHLLALGGGAAAIAVGRTVATSRLVAFGLVVVAATLVHPAAGMRSAPDPLIVLSDGSRIHVAGGAVVVELDASVRADILIEGLRRAGISRVDAVVARHGGRAVAEAVSVLRHRTEPRLVLAPRQHRVPNGSVAVSGSTVGIGGIEIHVLDVSRDRLDVEVRPRPP